MKENTQRIAYRFPDLPALKKAYMGYVREGGIFVPTENSFHLGDSVTATLTLPTNDLSFTFTAEVIWVTPGNGTSSTKPAGIGLQCGSDEGEAFQKAVYELIGTTDDVNDSDTM